MMNHQLDFEIDMSAFTSSIKTNFFRLWEMVEKNNKEIEECKERINMMGAERIGTGNRR